MVEEKDRWDIFKNEHGEIILFDDEELKLENDSFEKLNNDEKTTDD